MKKYYLLFGVLGVMVVAAAIIGWTNSTNSFSFSNGLASDGSVSFNYPENLENMENNTNYQTIMIGTENWKEVGKLGNDNIDILVQKSLSVNPRNARDDSNAAVREHGDQVISSTEETNPNGVEVFKSITAIKDHDTNGLLKYYDLTFTDKGATYVITVYGPDSKDTELSATADMIFNSIKTG